MPGDYDGNGTTDIAVFRPSEGVWYVRDQAPYLQSGATSCDIPLPLPYAHPHASSRAEAVRTDEPRIDVHRRANAR